MIVTLESIAERIRAGEYEQAQQALDAAKRTEENDGELLFLRGYLRESTYDREGALAAYEEVLERDPDHVKAAFRAAWLCDQGGDDEAAIERYEQCTARTPAPVNALLNLAALYEEHGRLDDAETILMCVLEEYPNHVRARQFLRSVRSSRDMMFDEWSQRDREKRDAILETPITDFELSVRSRNCLRGAGS